ncbi:hypothetical protein [Microbacterium sp. CIAB417]|uniref:hypothetical protein n=1 Tax=Microbacterium sp. CIAB417 TaxID=2860287 RepID=UPI001FADAECC|nr:hypothetical protein [Microbacterium sp. CIAB417]
MRKRQDDEVLVPGVHRAIRALANGEGPWPGTLVSDGDAVAVWCALNEESEAAIDWRFAGAEHVAAPFDVARSAEGHGALMPWCTARVPAFLVRRTTAAAPLAAGECVTLVISMLRGLREIADRAGADLRGQWWLTHEGRPLCVPGGAANAREGVVEVLEQVQQACEDRALRRILSGIAEAVAEAVPTSARVRAWEGELLDYAAPRPLRLDEHPPQAVRGSAAQQLRVVPVETATRRRRREERHSPLRRARDSAAGILARVAGAVPRAAGRGGERHRAAVRPRAGRAEPVRPRSHRRTAVVAAAAAAVVLGVGTLWPTQDDPASEAAETVLDASAAPTPSETSAVPGAEADTTQPPEPGTTTPESETERSAQSEGDRDDPVAAVQSILAALDECAANADAGCSQSIAAGSHVSPEDVLRSDAAEDPALVDDYGDLAVIRLGSADVAQMLVLVRQDGKWLVRDVYDVADQPKG